MSIRAKALFGLYRRGKVTADGLRQAVSDGVITAAEYQEMTGMSLSESEAATE